MNFDMPMAMPQTLADWVARMLTCIASDRRHWRGLHRRLYHMASLQMFRRLPRYCRRALLTFDSLPRAVRQVWMVGPVSMFVIWTTIV